MFFSRCWCSHKLHSNRLDVDYENTFWVSQPLFGGKGELPKQASEQDNSGWGVGSEKKNLLFGRRTRCRASPARARQIQPRPFLHCTFLPPTPASPGPGDSYRPGPWIQVRQCNLSDPIKTGLGWMKCRVSSPCLVKTNSWVSSATSPHIIRLSPLVGVRHAR